MLTNIFLVLEHKREFRQPVQAAWVPFSGVKRESKAYEQLQQRQLVTQYMSLLQA